MMVDGRCENEIRQRIGIAKNAFGKMMNVVTHSHVKIETRIRVIQANIWAPLMYVCETWTINKDMERKLDVFEAWCWRRMMIASWLEKKTKSSIFKESGKERELLKIIE